MNDTATKKLPDWLTVYNQSDVNNLPWHFSQLDPDLFDFLAKQNVVGGTFLDLGTGTGRQAVELARRGFEVVGTDLSPKAIELARDLSKREEIECHFAIDNILQTTLPSNRFDYVFDRGCFHILPPENRSKYVASIAQLMKRRGVLFLKCFSSNESWENGPYRFTREEIKKIFASHFDLAKVQDTIFHGQRDPDPLALFCVLKRNARE